MSYTPASSRYDAMVYRRCGASGLKLPAISLGLWHNFGNDADPKTKRSNSPPASERPNTNNDLTHN